MVMAIEQPDLFLCHSAADKDWVRELGARLECESIDGTSNGRRIRVPLFRRSCVFTQIFVRYVYLVGRWSPRSSDVS